MSNYNLTEKDRCVDCGESKNRSELRMIELAGHETGYVCNECE